MKLQVFLEVLNFVQFSQSHLLAATLPTRCPVESILLNCIVSISPKPMIQMKLVSKLFLKRVPELRKKTYNNPTLRLSNDVCINLIDFEVFNIQVRL